MALCVLLSGCAGSDRAAAPVAGDSRALAGWLAEGAPPAADRAVAVGLLAQGSADAAVAWLGRLPQDDWRTANDLAVAFLERAASGERVLDPLRALESALAARAAAPARPEPLYNLALASSRISLAATGRALFSELGERDDVPAGRRERAAAELERLSAPSRLELWTAEKGRLLALPADRDAPSAADLVERFPYETRRFGQLELLARWLAARDGERRRLARIGLELGGALAAARGDATVREVWRALELGPSPECEAAFRAYAAGATAFFAGEGDRAEAELRRAVSELGACDSEALRRWAEYYEVYSRFYGQVAAAMRDLEALLESTPAERYPSLVGRLEWRLGTGHANLGDSRRALEHYERGTDWMLRSSGDFGAAFGDILIGEALGELGEVERAWAHRLRGFARLQRKGEVRQIHSMLNEAIRDLVRHGRLAAAVAFAGELERQGAGSGNPSLIFDVHRQRALVAARRGDADEARASLRAARAQLDRIGDGALAAALAGRLDLVETALPAAGGAAAALDLADRAVASARLAGDAIRLRGALWARAEILHRLGEDQAAATDLYELLRSVEELRGSAAVDDRAAALALSQGAFDRLLTILLDQGRCEDGFALAERSRARLLLDRSTTAAWPRSPIDAGRARRLLGPGESLIEFAVLETETVAWRVTPEAVRCHRLPIGRAGLERLSARFATATGPRFGEPETARDLERLHAALLAPLELGPGIERLFVVPDRTLLRVPFLALRDPRSGSFLGASRAVSVSPSASLLAAGGERRRRASGPPLLVADPDLSRTEYAWLEPLRGARGEVAAISRLAPDSRRLVGAGATRAEFRRLKSGARWIHFAGHSIINPDRPQRSLLLFADGPGSFELFAPAGDAPRMVVLSACRTLDGFSVDREGPLGVAGFLFAGGVEAVVATLWPIDDRASAAFVPRIYEHLLDGNSASRAVQLAVRETIAADREPLAGAAWASLVVLERTEAGG